MIEELKKMNEEIAELKANHLERSKALFTKISDSLFDKHPKLEFFIWNQYTPYFNDGDECVFRCNKDDVVLNDSEAYENEFEDETTVLEYGNWDNATRKYIGRVEGPNPKYDKDLCNALIDVKELLDNIDESTLKELFGDHVEITVRKGSVSVEEYGHD
jgi:hypothetical protein